MENFYAADIIRIVKSISEIMLDEKEYLFELDSDLGDGDLGLTMCKGFTKALESIENVSDPDIGKVLSLVGNSIALNAPSTMGTLLATGFIKSSKALMGKQKMNIEDLAQMFTSFTESIIANGKSKPGDKTVIDSLYPAAQALQKAADNNEDLKRGIVEAYQAALDGAEKAKNMVSQHGKAACFGVQTLGKHDPGAIVGTFILKGFLIGIGNDEI